MNAQIQALLQESLRSDSKAHAARQKLREHFDLDEANWDYFFTLYRAKKGALAKKPIRIHEPNLDENIMKSASIAYPLSIAPPELRGSIEITDYAQLKNSREELRAAAKNCALWVKKMQAGSGSSLSRSHYLSQRLGIPESQVRIGAKGTDLMIDLDGKSISIAEAQILQSLESLERGEIGELIFQDIVSSETEEAIRSLWDKPYLKDPRISYRDHVEDLTFARRFGTCFQAYLPTLDERGEISTNRRAPGGHAFFALDALQAAYREELRPRTARTLISSISNGEDLNSSPDPLVLGYVSSHRIPIALVTTDRTAVDAKGGMLSLLAESDGSVSLTILETAQAAEAGQEQLFSSLAGMINTNLAIFNYEVLSPLITQEVRRIGEDAFLSVIAPDVISNAKKQRDSDGVTRTYVQLEGAMGSTLMNLDRYWRRTHGTPLVHLINVDRMHRTEFFSPIKNAFDYFMQFHSDRFELDPATFRLLNHRPGEIPQISLRDPDSQDKYWQDVSHVLEAFEGAHIRDLKSLDVEGKVLARGQWLRGDVKLRATKAA